jgi:hypothetical protein
MHENLVDISYSTLNERKILIFANDVYPICKFRIQKNQDFINASIEVNTFEILPVQPGEIPESADY